MTGFYMPDALAVTQPSVLKQRNLRAVSAFVRPLLNSQGKGHYSVYTGWQQQYPLWAHSVSQLWLCCQQQTKCCITGWKAAKTAEF